MTPDNLAQTPPTFDDPDCQKLYRWMIGFWSDSDNIDDRCKALIVMQWLEERQRVKFTEIPNDDEICSYIVHILDEYQFFLTNDFYDVCQMVELRNRLEPEE